MRTKGRLLPAKNSGTNAGAGMRSHTPPALAALQAKVDAHVARQGPPIQAKIAADTTFGLEIEFQNRWVSLYDLGKSVPPMAMEAPLTGWHAESDAGRLLETEDGMISGTVLELESRPYTTTEMNDGTVADHIQTAYDTSKTVAETSAGRVSVISKGHAAAPSSDVTPTNRPAMEKKIHTDHGAAPEATLQITTLGKRTPEHLKALADTSDSFDAKNLEIATRGEAPMPEEVTVAISTARKDAMDEALGLKGKAAALTSGTSTGQDKAKLIYEDFAATLTPLISIIKLTELGQERGWGTIKNLIAPVLPRRIIRPPAGGYAAALKIDAGFFKDRLNGYLKRIRAFDGSYIDPEVFLLWSQLAKGTFDEDTVMDEDDNRLGNYLVHLLQRSIERDKRKPPPERYGISLLHTIAGSEPTLEDKIIKGAGKDPKDGWTSHEIRNALYAQRMSAAQMKEYIALLKAQT